MGEIYTQGLAVSGRTRFVRERRLPVRGTVQVQIGETVYPDTVVARTDLPGKAEIVNVSGLLGISPEEVPDRVVKREGDYISRGDLLGESSGFFGFFKSRCISPSSGYVESISRVTGQVVLRGHQIPVELRAYLDGRVAEILPDEGAMIEAEGTFVQGIFGVGGEAWGLLSVRVKDGADRLDADQLDDGCSGKIVVVGRALPSGWVERAAEHNIRGIVVGSITDRDLRTFLGFDLAGAITGSETLATTLVITEGFGDLPMAPRTFEVLNACQGRRASINGRTQIRAGVIRPEVFVALSAVEGDYRDGGEMSMSLRVGALVRGTREPYFGKVGRVAAIPDEPVELETEAWVRAVELRFEDGGRALVPVSNVEAI